MPQRKATSRNEPRRQKVDLLPMQEAMRGSGPLPPDVSLGRQALHCRNVSLGLDMSEEQTWPSCLIFAKTTRKPAGHQ